MSMKKHHRSQDRRNFQSVVRSLFVISTRVTTLHSCYNFALVLHENALVFFQSEARNFFLCTSLHYNRCNCTDH